MKYILLIAALLLFSAQAFALGNPVVSVQSTVAESSHILKSTAGSLFGFSATSGASAGYVLFFDAISNPNDGTVTPKLCYQLPANSTIGASWINYPIAFSTGIVVEFSSTGCFTKTDSNTAFFSAQVQ